ncbi:hypothetical protein UFOVP1290_544 [uncultured Caudovirales phage]|uniref:Uncharacterized protein n=1 Tax=uncultured Caudovirales phage TaxID=2100421 RepID=A0A6J5RY65_9CAUD|nr:hypothetical protein UFOVP1290_544 [uncultured Caudovirales phage]
MSRRKARDIIFICSAIDDGKLISEMIISKTSEQASSLFKDRFGVLPGAVHGPCWKKPIKKPEAKTSLKFANKMKKAIYNDWEVNAFYLLDPSDFAYLVFIKRTDNQKMPVPKGTVIVPISKLRLLNE